MCTRTSRARVARKTARNLVPAPNYILTPRLERTRTHTHTWAHTRTRALYPNITTRKITKIMHRNILQCRASERGGCVSGGLRRRSWALSEWHPLWVLDDLVWGCIIFSIFMMNIVRAPRPATLKMYIWRGGGRAHNSLRSRIGIHIRAD